MEGFSVPVEKMRPTDEPMGMENREEKVERAEKSVVGMFKANMEVEGVIRRVQQNPGFDAFEQRN